VEEQKQQMWMSTPLPLLFPPHFIPFEICCALALLWYNMFWNAMRSSDSMRQPCS
jgi:hypothetical protein